MSETDNKTEQNLSTQNNNSETSEENVMKGGGNSFLSLYKLWIKKYKPNIYSKIYKWLPVNDYYAMKLSGNISTDYSQAMRTLLFMTNPADDAANPE